MDVEALEARISDLAPTVDAARGQIGRILVGQTGMVDALLIGLLANGHILLEGAPGLAKTTAVKAAPVGSRSEQGLYSHRAGLHVAQDPLEPRPVPLPKPVADDEALDHALHHLHGPRQQLLTIRS